MVPNSRIGLGKYFRFTFSPACSEKIQTQRSSDAIKEYEKQIKDVYEALLKEAEEQKPMVRAAKTFDQVLKAREQVSSQREAIQEFAPINEQGCSFRPYKNLAKKFEGEIDFDYLQFGEDDAAL